MHFLQCQFSCHCFTATHYFYQSGFERTKTKKMLSYANRKRRILVDSSEDEEENRGKENHQIIINRKSYPAAGKDSCSKTHKRYYETQTTIIIIFNNYPRTKEAGPTSAITSTQSSRSGSSNLGTPQEPSSSRGLSFSSASSSESYTYGAKAFFVTDSSTHKAMDLIGLGKWKLTPYESPYVCLGIETVNYNPQILSINLDNLDEHLRRKIGLENMTTKLSHNFYLNINGKRKDVTNHVIIFYCTAYKLKAINYAINNWKGNWLLLMFLYCQLISINVGELENHLGKIDVLDPQMVKLLLGNESLIMEKIRHKYENFSENFRKGVFKMCKGELKFGPPETWEFIKKIFKNKTKFHARSVCFRSIQQHHMDKAREKIKRLIIDI
jgi:hypothetical protein